MVVWLERYKNILIAAVLAFAGICCLPAMLNLKGNSLAVSNSYASVLLWAGCFYALYRTGIQPKAGKGAVTAGIFSFLLSSALAFGAQLENGENVNFLSVGLWISILVWTYIFSLWVCRIWKLLKNIKQTESRDEGIFHME